MNAYDFVAGQPWALFPAAVPGLLALAERHPAEAAAWFAMLPGGGKMSATADIQTLDSRGSKDWRPARETPVRDGVARLDVRGPISRYANLMHDVCAATSVQRLSADLAAAVENPKVKAVVLSFDTPGGQANGIGELAGQIRAAGKVKPVVAYVANMACSAGYWLAASCPGGIVTHPGASEGSIGAILQVDTTKPKDQLQFVSSQSPNKRSDPNTKDGAADIQRWVDALAAVFIADVAACRGMTPEEVQSDFGRGGVMLGAAAVECGMADALGDFESLQANLSAGRPAFPPHGLRRRKHQPTPGKAKAVARSFPTPKGAPMNFAKLFGLVAKTNPEAAAAAMAEFEDDAPAAPAAQAPAPTAAQAPAAKAVDADAIRAEIKAEFDREREADRRATASAFYQGEASAWFDGLVSGGKALPKDKAKTVARYVEAAMSDRFSGPLSFESAPGTPETASRLADLKADLASAPSNGRLVQVVGSTDASAAAKLAGLTVLPQAAAEGADKESDDYVASLLAATPVGQTAAAALKLVRE